LDLDAYSGPIEHSQGFNQLFKAEIMTSSVRSSPFLPTGHLDMELDPYLSGSLIFDSSKTVDRLRETSEVQDFWFTSDDCKTSNHNDMMV